ncbi:MAG: phospholipase A [Pseudomonadota bacterium]
MLGTYLWLRVSVAALVFLPCLAVAESTVESCLQAALRDATDETTVGELRQSCQSSADHSDGEPTSRGTDFETGSIRQRIEFEDRAEKTAFAFTPHFPNYIAYSAVDEPNQAPFAELVGVPDPVEDNEAVFQISIKAPVWRDMWGTELSTYFAYTAKSWWQVANDDFSNPFRETNYQPELFVRSEKPRQILGASLEGWSVGLAHESNGREELLSRSWNRVIARGGLQLTDDLSLFAQTWYRIPDDEEEDENPNEYRFLGYGDMRLIWAPNRSTWTAMVRPGTEETSFELTWSYPLSRAFRLYAAYFNGYGESLIDYDAKIERISIGIALNDFLGRP